MHHTPPQRGGRGKEGVKGPSPLSIGSFLKTNALLLMLSNRLTAGRREVDEEEEEEEEEEGRGGNMKPHQMSSFTSEA